MPPGKHTHDLLSAIHLRARLPSRGVNTCLIFPRDAK